MPRERTRLTRRNIQVLAGLILAAMLYFEFQFGAGAQVIVQQQPTVLAATPLEVDPFESMLRSDPLAALKAARNQHLRNVRDYQCVMIKQEVLPSGMSEEQEIEVKFRQNPFSVYMNWVRNPGLANRVIYVKHRWIDEDADPPEERELAVAQPGKVARFFIKSVQQPIRGKMARKSSRRYLDEFGFERAMHLIIKYCDIARGKGELRLEFRGESRFDGRPVWVVRRTLPYTGPKGPYPDRVAEIYIDKEYRIPVAVYCYADETRSPSALLGKYEYRNIRFHTGLTDKDFEPATYGM